MLTTNPDRLPARLLRIGLTGGIGCGKSTALEGFSQGGYAVLQADLISRRILENDAELQATLEAEFGPGIRTPVGGIDRGEVARMVFADSAKLRFLESLLHPRVRAEWTAFANGAALPLVVEIPLLFEKALHHEFDITVCVAASPEVQTARLLARGYEAETIRQRIAHQLPVLDKAAKADYVLWNNGSHGHLLAQIQHLLTSLNRRFSA